MVASVAGEDGPAYLHHYIRPTGEVCWLVAGQARAHTLPTVRGTATSGPAYLDVLKAACQIPEALPKL